MRDTSTKEHRRRWSSTVETGKGMEEGREGKTWKRKKRRAAGEGRSKRKGRKERRLGWLG